VAHYSKNVTNGLEQVPMRDINGIVYRY